jgi:hypothetical protein
MRDANKITDLTFKIEELAYSVEGVYLTSSNLLYVKLIHPINKSSVNYHLGEFATFAENHSVTLNIKPGSDAKRDLISNYLRSIPNLDQDS